MATDRLTWLGLAIAIVGWAVLVLDMTVSEALLRAGNLVAVLSLRTDIVTISQTAILSGFGLSVIGTLRGGFRLLAGLTEPTREPPAAVTRLPEPLATVAEPIEPEVLMPQSPGRPSTPPLRERNYVILPDGSVEVETLLGTRIFASLDEARDFIR